MSRTIFDLPNYRQPIFQTIVNAKNFEACPGKVLGAGCWRIGKYNFGNVTTTFVRDSETFGFVNTTFDVWRPTSVLTIL
jgi:hypothetical protein